MRHLWAAALIAMFLFVGLTEAAEEAQKKEAAGAKGKAAALEEKASVVMNRLGHEGFPNPICGVVKQGHER